MPARREGDTFEDCEGTGMRYIDCPGCSQRLRAPDSDKPMVLRCPACKTVFDSATRTAVPVGAAAGVAGGGEGRAGAGLLGGEDVGGTLTEADEAMLREFGTGTGLLDLTRDSFYDTMVRQAISPDDPAEPSDSGDAGEPAQDKARAGSAPAPAAQAARPGLTGGAQAGGEAAPQPPAARLVPKPPRGGAEAERQFQIVATALTLANKLVLTHRSEAARARRSATGAWLTAVVLLAAAGAAALWATQQSGRADLERTKAGGAADRLKLAEDAAREEKSRQTKQAGELDAARADYRKVQTDLSDARTRADTLRADLTTAREALAETKAAVQVLTAAEAASKASMADLTRQLDQARAARDELAAAVEELKAKMAKLAAPAAASQPSTMPAAAETPETSASPAGPTTRPAASPP